MNGGGADAPPLFGKQGKIGPHGVESDQNKAVCTGYVNFLSIHCAIRLQSGFFVV